MTVDETRQVMMEFRDALLTRGPYQDYFSDDVTVDWMGYGRQAANREAARQFIGYFQNGAFQAELQVKSLVCGENEAFAEAMFNGLHIGDFIGVAATGKPVSVPYCVAYSLADGKITSLRIYVPADVLLSQLRTETATAS